MKFSYQQWDGTPFPTQDHLKAFSHFLEYVMAYGDEALDALREIEQDPAQKEIIDQWIKDGLLEKIGVRFRLTPRAINSIQRKALMEVFQNLTPDSSEGHETQKTGFGGERTGGTRPFVFGDPVSNVDLNATLRNTIARAGLGVPLPLKEEDVEVHQTESAATCSTVILLDMSGSMSRWNRFVHAKKCAMAVHALIRQRFALDTVDVVGFATGAEVIREDRLPLAQPKQISTYDPVIRMKLPLSKIAEAPQHFTNLQLGLKTARQLLARRGGTNKQIFIITDGQPTAHVQGDYVHLLYPPDQATTMATLSEALMLSRQGVRFSTFALIEDYYYMDWVAFVDQLTKLTRGIAFYTTGGDLANCVMESYLKGRKSKVYLS